jgi:hypothetical protein
MTSFSLPSSDHEHLLDVSGLWRALRRLRAPVQLDRLADSDSPRLFFDGVFQALAGNLTVATPMLPRAVAEEVKLAFLCCRVLDAHENLVADAEASARGILEAAQYLTSDHASPPPAPVYRGTRETDRLDALLAERLDWLREALGALPRDRRERMLELVQDLAAAKAEARLGSRAGATKDGRYAERVLGRAARYGIELLGGEVPPTVDLGPPGRTFQAINDLRDLRAHPDASGEAEADVGLQRLMVKLELARAAVATPSALRGIRFARLSRARGAVAYIVATTFGSLAKAAGVARPGFVKHPVAAAAAAATSQRSYLRLLAEADVVVLRVLVRFAEIDGETHASRARRLRPAARLRLERRAAEREWAAADRHPDPGKAAVLKEICRLVRFSLLLTNQLPEERLSERAGEGWEGRILLLSDALIAFAFERAAAQGPRVLAQLSAAFAHLMDDRHGFGGRAVDPCERMIGFVACAGAAVP